MSEYDESIERLIDRAGRERVFAIAREQGWTAFSAPPAYVWRQIAEGLIADPQWRPAPAQGYGDGSLAASLGLSWVFGGIFG